MSIPKSFPLKVADGKTIDIPPVGFGTGQASEGGWCKDAVLLALKAGYRHLDCAWVYGVNQEIGEAIRESGISRSEIFVTSVSQKSNDLFTHDLENVKFWPHFAAPENVELCLDICLKEMGLEYMDLWLAHWPYASKPTSRSAPEKAAGGHARSEDQKAMLMEGEKPVVDWEHCTARIAKEKGKQGGYIPTWEAMQALVKKGKTRAIGLSNFSISDIKEILPHAKDIPISCNQIEVHPWLPQNGLISFAREHGIVTTCYSPFTGQKANDTTLLKDSSVKKLTEKNKMDVDQLLQSWTVQKGTVPLGKSSTPDHIKSNLNIRKLSDKDMKTLDSITLPNSQGRTIDFTET